MVIICPDAGIIHQADSPDDTTVLSKGVVSITYGTWVRMVIICPEAEIIHQADSPDDTKHCVGTTLHVY